MNKKALEVKHNHHHVWADYLRRWSSDGKNIYYTTNKGNVVHESIKGVAKERDFYKITELSEFDVTIIKSASKHSPLALQQHHMSYLADFINLDNIYKAYKAQGRQNSKFEAHHRALKHNLLENLHSAHERKASPILKSLANADLSILEDLHHMIEFMMYFGHQYTRTKNFKDIALSVLSRNNDFEVKCSDSMAHAWWFHSYMMGMNIGKSLFETRHIDTHALLINNSPTPFITSDQPIINIHPCLTTTPQNTPPKYADFFYPISPTIAYVICNSDTFKSGINYIENSLAKELNEKLAKRANAHIFGTTPKSIDDLRSLLGKAEKRPL